MKKFFSAALICAIMCGLFFGISIHLPAHAATDQLFVYNWGDYIDDNIIKDFKSYYERKTNNTLNFVYTQFETNEEMLTKIMLEGAKVDLICPSEYAIERLVRNNMLTKLDKSKLSNINNIDDRIYTKVDAIFDDLIIDNKNEQLSDYFIPYMWGTLGILYNKDVVRQKDIDAGWGILWNKGDNKKLDRKIYVKDSVRDTYVAAVLYLKENNLLPSPYKNKTVQQLINTVDNVLLELVEEALVEQIPYIKDYEVDFGQADMMAKKAYVNLAWSGDAIYAIEESNVPLDYFIPKVGGNVWFDGWVMPKDAPNKEIAYMFLDYLCRPEVAIKNSMEIGYTNGLSIKALESSGKVRQILLSNDYDIEEYFTNPLRYPDIDDEKLGVMKDFGNMHEEAMAMWERVKARGNKIWILIIAILASVIIGGSVLAFVILKNNKGRRRISQAEDD